MPRYYFNVHHELHANKDWDGVELPDKNAAWEKATTEAGKMIQEIDGDLRPGHEWKMEVTDEFANPLWIIHVNAEKK